MVPAGQQIVSLQSLDPVYVNFALPQQRLAELKQGLAVRVTSDAIPGRDFKGKLIAINSQVDEVTRNVQVQATLENKEHLLKPGMFVNSSVILPREEENDRHPGDRDFVCALRRFRLRDREETRRKDEAG